MTMIRNDNLSSQDQPKYILGLVVSPACPPASALCKSWPPRPCINETSRSH